VDVARAVYQEGLSVGRPLGLDAPPEGFLRCAACGQLAKRRQNNQVSCGTKACKMRLYRRAAQRRPEWRAKNRARAARWYAEHREEHIAAVVERGRKQAEPHWFIADHAVQQWRARYGQPGDTMAEARERLLSALRRAHYVRPWTDDATELWRSGKPWRARFVVVRHETTLDLVTVLPPFDGWRR
jgi:hypothetical protein